MKYNTLNSRIDRPFFSSQSLQLAKLLVFNYQLTAWTKKNYIKQLKRGIYYFTDRKNDLTPQGELKISPFKEEAGCPRSRLLLTGNQGGQIEQKLVT